MRRSRSSRAFSTRRQRGAAALVVTLLLFFAMALATLFTHRNLVFEQRGAINQYRSTQAFEAAEAGLEWALAALNTNRGIGADCLPGSDPAATSFRMRYLAIAPIGGAITPLAGAPSGPASVLQARCIKSAGGWSCSCPATGAAAAAAAPGNVPATAFAVQFLAADKQGVVRIVATGCSGLAEACGPAAIGRPDATAKVEAALGLLPALRTAPSAAVTLRGTFDAGTAAIGLHNPDPATGVAVDAGGGVQAPMARLTAPAGTPTADSLVAHDAALAATPAERFFASYFGVDKATWANQPGVVRIACGGDCGSALAAAIAAAPDIASIWVDGDLALTGPLTLGSLLRPVVIVVGGSARIDGAVALFGALHATGVTWTGTSGGAFLRGAALAEADYRGSGSPEFFYDAAVLGRLTGGGGSFVRINGSWRDF